MTVKSYRFALLFSGAAAVAAISFGANGKNSSAFVAELQASAEQARDEAGGNGVKISFRTAQGWLTRHPQLSGGFGLDGQTRARTAAAIAGVPGIGGVSWRSNRSAGGVAGNAGEPASLHCQEDVEAILRVRTIRFAEASARIDRASQKVLDEVATALLPCVGSIIAITGHTDSNGDEGANLALSRARADAVRWALIGRGIPADGLRATGIGSEEPLEGLAPEDSANRRIEFSVIETMPLQPTPIDVPGAG